MRRLDVAALGANGAGGSLRLPALNLPFTTRHWLMFSLLVTLSLLAYQAASNERFFVYAAQVRGNQRVTTAAIYEASQVDIRSIFWLRPDDIARRVLQLPGVSSVAVHIRLPNQVIIDVQENQPFVNWKKGTTSLWLGNDGSGLPATGKSPSLNLIDPGGLAADSKGSLRSKLLADLQSIHSRRPDIGDVYYGAQEGLYFQAPQGWTVYLGQDGDVDAKLVLLGIMQSQIAAQATPAKIVDLRIDGKAIYR
jgi:hypothetical protein